MAVRKGVFRPDRKIDIMKESDTDGELSWSVLTTVYAQRRDMRGGKTETEGTDIDYKTVTYVVPKDVIYSVESDFSGSDALGAREINSAPLGGRGKPTSPRLFQRGSNAQPGFAIRDKSIQGFPLFLIVDMHELIDRKNIELVCKRQSSSGESYVN